MEQFSTNQLNKMKLKRELIHFTFKMKFHRKYSGIGEIANSGTEKKNFFFHSKEIFQSFDSSKTETKTLFA